MKKRLTALTFLLLCSLFSNAGTTNVTATITGADSVVWANGSYIISFRPTPGKPLDQFNVNGATFPQGPFTGNLNSSGTFSITLTDNLTISPSGSMWSFTVCPNATYPCFTSSIVVTGVSQNLSTALSSVTPAIKIFAEPIPKAYNNTQVTTPVGTGGAYWDVTFDTPFFWNGSTWIGVGGNLKTTGTPTPPQQAIFTDSTHVKGQDKPVIDIRDKSGIDCTGASDSSAAFQIACSNNVFQRLSTNGCTYIRLDNPVSCFANEYFDIGNDSNNATRLLGCGGGVGPLITFQRSGHGRIHGLDVYTDGGSYCGANPGLYTQGILLDNDFVTYPGGFTTTDLTIDGNSFHGNVTNWIGFGTTGAQNMEYLRIWDNNFYGIGTNSTDIFIGSLNSQGDDIYHNALGGAYYGIQMFGPQFIIRDNVIDAGDAAVYGTGGAAIRCRDGFGPSIIEDNSANERSGNFFRNDTNGCAPQSGGPVVFNRNLLGGDGTAVPANTYMIDVGSVGGLFVFKNNRGSNAYGNRPIIGTTAGGYDNVGGFPGAISDENNTWGSIPYDTKGPTLGFHFKSLERSVPYRPDISSFDELQVLNNWNAYNGTTNPPAKIWRTGNPGLGSYIDYATGVLDNVYQQSTNGNSFILGSTIRNDAALPTGMVVPQSLLGGLKITAAMAVPTPTTQCMGGGSGSTWGYKVSCTSGGSTVYTTAEITQDCSATLDSTHWNRIVEKKTPGYEKCGIWITTNPGDGRGTGLIGQFNVLSPPQTCSSIDSGQGCDGQDQRWYSTDKGQAIITAGSPPVSTSTTGIITVPKLTGITDTTVVTNLNADTLDGFHAGNASTGHAICWKDATHMGYCSDVVSVTGTCTCN